jgi:hypothetical protein
MLLELEIAVDRDRRIAKIEVHFRRRGRDRDPLREVRFFEQGREALAEQDTDPFAAVERVVRLNIFDRESAHFADLDLEVSRNICGPSSAGRPFFSTQRQPSPGASGCAQRITTRFGTGADFSSEDSLGDF